MKKGLSDISDSQVRFLLGAAEKLIKAARSDFGDPFTSEPRQPMLESPPKSKEPGANIARKCIA